MSADSARSSRTSSLAALRSCSSSSLAAFSPNSSELRTCADERFWSLSVLAPSSFQNRLPTRLGEPVLVFVPVFGSVFGTHSRYADVSPRRLRRSHNDDVTTVPPSQVLIAGAGPIGLTAAIELTRRGISCLIIDSLLEPPLYAKAVCVQPRTLELFEAMGVLRRILDAATLLHGQ